jgi:iron complex outermembrane receptor protein
VVVIKGPYSVLYGPAFSVLDVATLDAGRSNGLEVHGRTGGSYQTNGNRYDALQGVSVTDSNWGFRGTYNILQGSDYKSGNGTTIPGSYLSNNVNFALGLDLTSTSRLDIKGLRVVQNNLAFPGLYFDVRQLDTEAYSVRYSLFDQGLFDKLTMDVWYNSTASSGDTQTPTKQPFVQQLLAQSFNGQAGRVAPVASLVGTGANLFTDASATRFAGRSVGYRTAMSWGPKVDPYLTVGTDLNAFGQGLSENIVLQQYQGANLNTGVRLLPGQTATFTQSQSIPPSNQVTTGLFTQYRLPITDRFTVRGGGRVDVVNSSSNPRAITGNLDLFGPGSAPSQNVDKERFFVDPSIYSTNPAAARNLSRNDLLLAAFAQGEYKFDNHWRGLASFGHSERAPTLTELYAAGPFIGVLQQGTSRLIGDPQLRAERLDQFDVGLVADYDFFQGGANFFYARIQNYITYDANKTGLGLTQVVYTNTDRTHLAGGELFGQVNATAWLTPFGTLAYVQGIDETAVDTRRAANLDSSRRDDPATLRRKSATEPLPQIPPLDSRVGLRIHAPTKSPRWQVELSARMVAARTEVATSLNEYATPAFTTFNARGFWQATDRLLLSTGVENFTNKNYREHLDPISGNLLGVGQLLRPGRSFFFNAQLTY